MIVTDVLTSAGAKSDEAAVDLECDGRKSMRLRHLRSSETSEKLGERDALCPGAGFQCAVLIRLQIHHRLGLHFVDDIMLSLSCSLDGVPHSRCSGSLVGERSHFRPLDG